MKKNIPSVLLAALAVSTLSLSSCDTIAQGVGSGAAIGAIAGGLTGRGENALAGAAIGAAAGGLIAAASEQDYYARGYSEPYRSYPVAQASGRRGTVVSPYDPYNEIDVRGVPHGALVRDPSCGRLFIRP